MGANANFDFLSAVADQTLAAGGALRDALRTSDASVDAIADHADAVIYITLETLKAEIRPSGPDGIDVRAEFRTLWLPHYDTLGEGLRLVTAATLGVAPEDVWVSEWIRCSYEKVRPRMAIRLADHCAAKFDPEALHQTVSHFLDRLKNGPRPSNQRHFDLPAPRVSEIVSNFNDEPDDSGPLDETSCIQGRQDLEDQIAAISNLINAKIGGKTMPVSCEIGSPGWAGLFTLSGKLAPKPVAVPVPGGPPRKMLCLVDGFMRSKRVVYLLEKLSGKKRASAKVRPAFDEEKLGRKVARAAEDVGTLYIAEVQEAFEGTKVTFTLLDLRKAKEGDKFVWANQASGG